LNFKLEGVCPQYGASSGYRWRIAANGLNKQSQTADNRWSSSLSHGAGYQPLTVWD